MTDTDLLQEIEADLQRQKFEAFWKSWGNTILTGVFVLVLGTAAYEWWATNRTQNEQAATRGLIELMQPQMDKFATKGGKIDPVKQVENLQNFASGTNQIGPSVLARYRAAASAVEAAKIEEAVKIYDDMAKDPKIEPFFRQLADLMAVQVSMDKVEKHDDVMMLLARLQPLMLEESAWRYSAREYAGHLMYKIGKREEALRLFHDLVQDPKTTASVMARSRDMALYLNSQLDAEPSNDKDKAAEPAVKKSEAQKPAPQNVTPKAEATKAPAVKAPVAKAIEPKAVEESEDEGE